MRLKDVVDSPYFFLVPPLILFFFIVYGCTFFTVFVSFTDLKFGSLQFNFIGLRNYLSLPSDITFNTSITNNLIWLAFYLTVPTFIGLFLAILTDQRIRGESAFRAIYYYPQIMSAAIVGVMWSWMYDPQIGLVNSLLRLVGLGQLTHAWLGERSLATFSLCVAAGWQQLGWSMLIFLAGLRIIPQEVQEAAEIDGATPAKRFRHIIMPMLKPAWVIVTVWTIIQALYAFDMIAATTGGGPGYSSYTLSYLLYDYAFRQFDLGKGAAVGVVLFVIVIVVVLPFVRYMAKEEITY